MDKKEFVRAIDSFKPDESLKERVYNKIINGEIQNECKVYREKRRGYRAAVLVTVCVFLLCIAALPIITGKLPLPDDFISMFGGKKITDEGNSYSDWSEESSSSEDQNKSQKQDDIISVNINSYYCDGIKMSIFYEIQTEDEKLLTCDKLEGKIKINVNGRPSDIRYTEDFSVFSGEPGNWSGILDVRATDIDIFKEGSEAEFTISDIIGYDTQNRYFNRDKAVYEQSVCRKQSLSASVNFSIRLSDDSCIKTYNVGDEKEGCVLNTVIVTPYYTALDISKPLGCYIEVSDSTGKNLEKKVSNSPDTDMYYLCDTPMKEASSIKIRVYSYNDGWINPQTVCDFDIPIECGYDISYQDVRRDVKYSPPLDEAEDLIQKRMLEDTDYVLPGGSGFETANGLTLTINSSEVINQITDEYTDGQLKDYISQDGTFIKGLNGLAIDVTVRNDDSLERSFDKKFVMQYALGETTNKPVAFTNALEALSTYSIEPGQEVNMKVVFIISDTDLKFPVFCTYGTGNLYRVRVN